VSCLDKRLVVAPINELDDLVAASVALREGLDVPAVAEDGAFVGEAVISRMR